MSGPQKSHNLLWHSALLAVASTLTVPSAGCADDDGRAAMLRPAVGFAASFADEKTQALMPPITADQVFDDQRVARLADAAASGDAALVRTLAGEGTVVNAHGDRGVTPLLWALLHANHAGIQALMAAGANEAQADDDGTTPMHLAAGIEDDRLLETLLHCGASPNVRDPLRGRTPIFAAILGDRIRQFEALLPVADLNAPDKLGNTPLHTAASLGDYTRMVRLLDHGADPRRRNEADRSMQDLLPRHGQLFSALSPTMRLARQKFIARLRAEDIDLIAGLQSDDAP